MSRITNCITLTAGAAAGLFIAGLASSATAAADTATPANPGLPGLLQQVISAPASIPDQLLQGTASVLGGASAQPAQPAQAPPLATATLNMPQTPAELGAGAPAGSPAAPGLPIPGNLSSVLPFPLPNLGGAPAGVPAPAPIVSSAFMPPAAAAVPGQAALGGVPLISGLP